MNIPSPSGLIWTLHEFFVSFDIMTRNTDDESNGNYCATVLSVFSSSKTTSDGQADYRIVGARETRHCLVLVRCPGTRSGTSICAAPAA